jgi:hypothetical protein
LEDDVINTGVMDHLELTEMMVLPFYVALIFLIAYAHQRKKILNNPSYSYYARGITFKLLGATIFCLVFAYHYGVGDTFSYFENARSFCNLLRQHPGEFLDVYFGSNSYEHFSYFDRYTGIPQPNIYFESRGFFTSKLLTPFVFLGFNSYLISSILLSLFSYFGIWRMYQVFYKYYPKLYKPLAIGFVFLPSAIFWGSGILKDTITLSAFCWFVSSVERGLISKVNPLKNILSALLSGYIVLLIKPYIIMACIPGLIVWLIHDRVSRFSNPLVRNLTLPFVFVISIAVGAGLMSYFSEKLDKFSLDKVLDTAVVSQRDLKRAEYKGHSFDIGEFDATVSGVAEKFPVATVAGLYRPFIWESGNFVMLLSGVENLLLLYLTLYPIVKIGPRRIMGIFFREPLLLFIFSYSILFAFSIGISTSNFGALIRFKIAFAPFMAGMLLIFYNQKKLKLLAPPIAAKRV